MKYLCLLVNVNKMNVTNIFQKTSKHKWYLYKNKYTIVQKTITYYCSKNCDEGTIINANEKF